MRRIMSRRSLNLYQTKHALFGRIERWLHPKMDLICGNSQAVVADLVNEGVRQDQLQLIYNGVAPNRFHCARSRREVLEELRIDPGALVIVIVANLIPYKGHADLIEALGLVRDRLPDPWVCLCVGRDDGIGDELRTRANGLGLGDRTRFLGSRADVPDLLRASDIGLLCSHEEGFSNAIIEGMICGLPMVVTDVGGNAEAVVHGVTGLVVPARDPEALGQALLQLCQDPERRSRMGKAGQKRAHSHYSIEACVAAYEALYRQQLRPLALD
jgi:glycosyltransferase involved in cell wall biosynthesis